MQTDKENKIHTNDMTGLGLNHKIAGGLCALLCRNKCYNEDTTLWKKFITKP